LYIEVDLGEVQLLTWPVQTPPRLRVGDVELLRCMGKILLDNKRLEKVQ
jgi:hypothetical protein